MIDIDSAIDVFAASFAYIRSYTHPFEVAKSGDLLILRDVPGRAKRVRIEEVVIRPGLAAEDALEQLHDYRPKGGYVLDVFYRMDQSVEEIKARYKPRGYRCLRTEPLMALDLRAVHPTGRPHEILRVETQQQADLVSKFAGERVLLPAHFAEAEPPVRVYYARKDGNVVGWTRAVAPTDRASYVAGMYTRDEWRRQGIGTALLARLATDDAAAGLKYSVLLASRVGSLLYASFGYEQIGTLVMFAPKRTSTAEREVS